MKNYVEKPTARVTVSGSVSIANADATEYLDGINSIKIADGGTLAINNGVSNNEFDHVECTSLCFQKSTGILNVVNVDPTTDIIALQSVDNSPLLTVDVTLQNGTSELLNTVDFQGASNLQNVRTIYVQYAELLLSFEEAVKDRREPALEEGSEPDFDLDLDLYQFESIKNVPGHFQVSSA